MLFVAVLLFLISGCGDDDDADAAAPDAAAMHGDAAVMRGTDAATAPMVQTDQLADGIVGTSCKVDADCGDGRCLLNERVTGTPYPGGFCTGSCRADDDCGKDGICIPGFRGGIGSCGLRCENDDDCGREGYRCRTVQGNSRCAPGPQPLPDHVVGNACEDDDDCGGGAMTCASKLGQLATPGGYCSIACAFDADCGAGGVCISGVNAVTLAIGTCYKGCVIPDGCRDGYTCYAAGMHDETNGACRPNAQDEDAGAQSAP